MLQQLTKAKVEEASFGRAAKLIAIYLKTTIVLSGAENTTLGRVIHPPIDSILLKAMR